MKKTKAQLACEEVEKGNKHMLYMFGGCLICVVIAYWLFI